MGFVGGIIGYLAKGFGDCGLVEAILNPYWRLTTSLHKLQIFVPLAAKVINFQPCLFACPYPPTHVPPDCLYKKKS